MEGCSKIKAYRIRQKIHIHTSNQHQVGFAAGKVGVERKLEVGHRATYRNLVVTSRSGYCWKEFEL